MALTNLEVRRITTAVRALVFNAPSARVEDFIARALGLNAAQQAQYFPDPDPTGLMGIAVGYLSEERETMLRDECQMPSFAVYQDQQNVFHVAGLDTYLATRQVPARMRGRLAHLRDVRTALRRMQ